MKYEFYEIEGFGILTNKKFRDVEGSIVWCVGRLGGTSEFYLDSRFRAEKVESGNFGEFTFCVSAREGFLFFPVERIDDQPWFESLRRVTANFIGLQSIRDQAVIDNLQEHYKRARYIQGELRSYRQR